MTLAVILVPLIAALLLPLLGGLGRIVALGATIATFRAGGAPPATVSGDVNNDSSVNATDALIILTCEAGIASPFCPATCGDVNNSGSVDATDALIILTFEAGLDVAFPVGEAACVSTP